MSSCFLCRSEKPLRPCDQCERGVCRECACFLDREQFKFHPAPPKVLLKTHFCFQCHEEQVVPEIEAYTKVLAKSQEVTVLSKAYRGQIPYLKKMQETSLVKDHLDPKEAVAHLAFLAAWNGFDALIGVESEWKKVRRHGYEHKEWTAKGHFARLDHKRFRWQE